MRPSLLTVGDLVRYQATTARWHLGIVREVDGDVAEVEFFCGDRHSVPVEQLIRFQDYLGARQRVLSLKRTALCEAFFGEPLHRLREERVRKIQKTLRHFGLSFHPEQWPMPATRVQIWRDDSAVLADGRSKEAKFEALLPRWLEPFRLPPSSRDPLGLQAHAERLANELLPGLTVFTSRIGYYGFLAWAIQCVNDLLCPNHQTRQNRLHRLERALALCEFVYHGPEDDSCRLLGQRSKTQVLQGVERDNYRYRVPNRILKNQASAGAYRLYFTSLQSMGIAQEAPDPRIEGETGNTLRAIERYKEAQAYLQNLAAAHPDNVTYQSDLARCSINLGQLSRLQGKGDDAEAYYRAALEKLEPLVSALN
jgi:hypothetical protein